MASSHVVPLCSPEANKIATLFHRRKTSTVGLNGLTSLRDSVIDGSTGNTACFSQSAPVRLSIETDPTSSACIDVVREFAALSLCRITFWYVRLRSWRNVSRKNRRKDRQMAPETIVRNQKMARQLKPVVRTPPRIGPKD